ncbi:hypothetical protein GN244_ATG20263 [Phytophthora infestans]|uniref:Uncharacterized protein n=1 Tax=Phytophthora infestans TaxID=4787 RepID=A0A833SJW8_PHYIN|nr:hypothetical protein GN244_ATG20263 [Phytophthora infestans]KAF4140188.1 hypothetical protein GN958_ATG10621 [Phytophthora infestans]
MARSRHIVNGRDQESQDEFEADGGDVCCSGNVEIHFRRGVAKAGVRSSLPLRRQRGNQQLGYITVREDYDVIEGSAFNSRIISSDENDVSTESNTIVFTQLFAQGNPRFGGEPCAVVASDCVDEDELYPYHGSDSGSERIRKDISGAIVLTVSRQQDKSELAVVMRRSDILKLHCPEFSLSTFAQQEPEDGIVDWGKVMITTFREVLFANYHGVK